MSDKSQPHSGWETETAAQLCIFLPNHIPARGLDGLHTQVAFQTPQVMGTSIFPLSSPQTCWLLTHSSVTCLKPAPLPQIQGEGVHQPTFPAQGSPLPQHRECFLGTHTAWGTPDTPGTAGQASPAHCLHPKYF